MFGLGMFLFEALWGLVGDRFGYRTPMVVAQVLYAICIFLLAEANALPVIAAGYLLAQCVWRGRVIYRLHRRRARSNMHGRALD